jgi:hypothetical protein
LLVEAWGALGSLDVLEELDKRASNYTSKYWCVFSKTSC